MTALVRFQSVDPTYVEPPSLDDFQLAVNALPHCSVEAALLFRALLKRQEELLAALLPFAVFGITIADARFMGKEGSFTLGDSNLYDATNAFGKAETLKAASEILATRKQIEAAVAEQQKNPLTAQ